jgi:hypothetical protein
MRSGQHIDYVDWMVNRMVLFEKYCVPSVKAQSCKNFEWMIVCDPATPDAWLKKIREVSEATVLTGDNWRRTSIEYIENNLTDEDRVITSRCDNDDALHKDYIKTIQDWFERKQRTGVVTFPKGWVWNEGKNKLHHCRYVKNHFLTFIEKRGKKPVKTVLRTRHTALTDTFKTFKIETSFHAWLEVIHSDNMANYSRGQRSDSGKLVMGDYGL